ncbi:MAG: pgl, partial [Frankiales bacterium]|nr:pgl [Frankiales bacterium]
DSLDLDPTRVHPMAAAPGDPEAGAAAYATAVEGASLDVLILGMGPEGHTASIFPFSPAAADDRAAVAVHDCPKPPPTRISLGFRTIQSARAVWVLATGAEKAAALARAYAGASQDEIPVAGARGTEQTLWILDAAAASQLPL